MYDELVDKLAEAFEETSRYETTAAFPGHLNYVITTLIKKAYAKAAELDGFQLCYNDYNEIVGMLECAKLEFYRRQISPYEDKKIEKNGDV